MTTVEEDNSSMLEGISREVVVWDNVAESVAALIVGPIELSTNAEDDKTLSMLLARLDSVSIGVGPNVSGIVMDSDVAAA